MIATTKHTSFLRRMSSSSISKQSFDYIIVGAGSAGSVLANRLSADPTKSVLLIEAGKADTGHLDSWTIQMPSALTFNLKKLNLFDRIWRNVNAEDSFGYNWGFQTTPQPNLNNRVIEQPRGKVLGGSSSVNAMAYVRGHAFDYDRWDAEIQLGKPIPHYDDASLEGEKARATTRRSTKEIIQDLTLPRWDYASCLPYFIKSECYDNGSIEPGMDSRYVGLHGPLQVRHGKTKVTAPLNQALIQAGKQAGYPETKDPNGFLQEGLGPMHMTVASNGTRSSTSNAYLKPIVGTRSNLEIRTETTVTQLMFDTTTGTDTDTDTNTNNTNTEPTATGVKCNTGDIISTTKDGQVILSLGSIGSPHLLMLSGIGPKEHLKEMGVKDIVLNAPGVGSNLQDHLDTYIQYECNEPTTLYPDATFPHRMIKSGLEWFGFGTGTCASNHFEAGGFIRTAAGKLHPDLQFHFIAAAVVGQAEFIKRHAFQLHCSTMRATSVGTLRLASTDPKDSPIIDPMYFSTEEDVIDYRNAVRLAVEIIEQPALNKFRGNRISPSLKYDLKNDEDVDRWIRETTHSAYHPCGTCAMGDVVDGEGRVVGINGLRVVDSSIMPSVVSGNLNAPTIMLAEKIADAIIGKGMLKPDDDVPVYVAEGWETMQRETKI